MKRAGFNIASAGLKAGCSSWFEPRFGGRGAQRFVIAIARSPAALLLYLSVKHPSGGSVCVRAAIALRPRARKHTAKLV
eukprot:10606434-Alexandrium_andersonii.AAC.1